MNYINILFSALWYLPLLFMRPWSHTCVVALMGARA